MILGEHISTARTIVCAMDRLRKFGESEVELDENANALTETGRVLSERLMENPQEAIDPIFLFAQDVSGYVVRSTFLRLDSVFALPGNDD